MNHLKKVFKTNWERKALEVAVDSSTASLLKDLYNELNFVKIELEALAYIDNNLAGIKAKAEAELRQWKEQQEQQQEQKDIKPDFTY